MTKYINGKPECQLIGKNDNIFNLLGLAKRTLDNEGLSDQAKEMIDRVHKSHSYYEALMIIGEYVYIN